MKDESFGFEVEQSEIMDAEETRNSVMADIKSHWGQKCLISSAPFILTLQ